MTFEELVRKVARLDERLKMLEEREKHLQQAMTADAWPPRPHLGYVPSKDVIDPPPFHDPVIE